MRITKEIKKNDSQFSIANATPLANAAVIEQVILDKNCLSDPLEQKINHFLTTEAFFCFDSLAKNSTYPKKMFKTLKKLDSSENISDFQEKKAEFSLKNYVFDDLIGKKQTLKEIKLQIQGQEQENFQFSEPNSPSPSPKIRGTTFLKLHPSPQTNIHNGSEIFNWSPNNNTQILNFPNYNEEKEKSVNNENEDILDLNSFKAALRERKFGVHEALFAVLICSQIRVSRERLNHQASSALFFENSCVDEIPLLKLCSDHDYLISQKIKDKMRNLSTFSLHIKGKRTQVNVAGINEYTKERGRYSIVIFDYYKNSEGGDLFVKGLAHKIIPVLKSNKRRNVVEALVAEGEKSGRNYVIYAKKHLNETELGDYFKKSAAFHTNLAQKTEEKNKFFNELECNLDYVAVISVENVLYENVKESIELFHQLHFKIWVMGGDSYNRVITSAYSSNIINQTTELWKISGDNLDEVQIAMKAVLENVQDILKRKTHEKQTSFEPSSSPKASQNGENAAKSGKKLSAAIRNSFINEKKPLYMSVNLNICLIISGESFEIILANKSLKKHFFFVCYLTHVIIGFKMKKHHKCELLKLIKKNDIFSPLVMAIGNGSNDIRLLQNSDFSIEFKSETNPTSFNAGDVLIGNWKSLNDIVLIHSRNCYEKIEQTTYHLFFTSFLFGFSLFIFNNYTANAGVYIFDWIIYLQYQYLLIPFPLLMFLFTANMLNPEKLKNNAVLYREIALRKAKTIKNLLVISFIPAIASALILNGITSSSFFYFNLENTGSMLDSKTMGVALYLLLTSVANLRVFLL